MLIPLFALSACALQDYFDPKEPLTKLVNQEFRYEITLPPGWSRHMQDSMALEERATRSKGAYATDGIYKTKKNWTTEFLVWHVTPYNSFGKIVSNDLNQAFTGSGPLGGKILEEETHFKGGTEFREVIYETRSDVRSDRKTKTTYVDNEDYVLIIRSSCISADFKKAKKDFDSIAGSLKFF